MPSHHFSATADDAHDGDTLFRAFLTAQPISHPHVRLRDYSPQPQMVSPMVIKHSLWTLSNYHPLSKSNVDAAL